MELADFLRLLLRRLWLVAALGLIAGGVAWLAVRDDPVSYEQTLTFVIRPASGIGALEIDDTLDGLASGDTVVETVSGTLSSERFLERAGGTAGLDADAVDDVGLEASTRPGSTVIDVRFQGPSPQNLRVLVEPYTAVCTRWVSRTYKIYTLEPLGSDSPSALPGQGGAVIALGVGFGLLIGVLAVLTEGFVRAGRRRAPAEVAGGQVKYTIETPGRDPIETFRLESILRQHLDDDEALVRTGPGRLVVVERLNGAPRERTVVER
jgi:hypothetical protein